MHRMAKFFLPFIGLITFLILFGVFLILGLIQHDKNKILVSILSFMLAITCAVFFALNMGKKLNSLLPNHITTDPGEVYSSQFGYLEDSCVFVKHAEAE